jgi:hypothetical protein
VLALLNRPQEALGKHTNVHKEALKMAKESENMNVQFI